MRTASTTGRATSPCAASQVTITEAQIGTTIDGFPNGTSDYFSGAKANRFVRGADFRPERPSDLGRVSTLGAIPHLRVPS